MSAEKKQQRKTSFTYKLGFHFRHAPDHEESDVQRADVDGPDCVFPIYWRAILGRGREDAALILAGHEGTVKCQDEDKENVEIH